MRRAIATSLALIVLAAPVAAANEGGDAFLERVTSALERAPREVAAAVEVVTSEDLAAPRDVPTAKVLRAGRPRSRGVALTFDDGFNSRACARIADTLRNNDAVGTFFINGNHLRNEPAKWRRILKGMTVANHTRSHRRLTDEPHAVVIKQIKQNEAIHERVLGRPMLKVLRPPYGAYGERIGRIAAGLGYTHLVMWNVDTGDWRPSITTRAVVRRATGARPGSIILMHCSRDATAQAMPRIVRHYKRRGIDLVGLEELLPQRG